MAPPKGFKPSKPFLKGNPGRPVGVKNKVTNLRDAVLGAFDDVLEELGIDAATRDKLRQAGII